MTIFDKDGVSRRKILTVGAGVAGGAMLNGGFVMPVFAADHPAIGTYPAGSAGSSVTIGGYAAQGEDELKGCLLYTSDAADE